MLLSRLTLVYGSPVTVWNHFIIQAMSHGFRKKDSLANGEIGIFYLNGNTYIKELHDEPDGVYLISLNQKYRPIQVLESDSFKIFGKVIGKCKGAEIPGFH